MLSQSVGCYPAVAGPIRRLLSLQPVSGAGEVNSRAVSRGPSSPLCPIQLLLAARNRFGTVVDRYLNDQDARWIFSTFPCISNSLCIGNGSKALEIIGQCSKSHREASNFPIGKRSEPRTLVGWGGRWRGDLTTEIVANEIKSDLKSVSVLETALLEYRILRCTTCIDLVGWACHGCGGLPTTSLRVNSVFRQIV